MATSSLGIDRAPLIDKGVLSQGVIAVRKQNVMKIFSADGQLVVQGSFESPVGILGFSPEGHHLFYERYDSLARRSQLRIIDFSAGTDEAVFLSPMEHFSPAEIAFHPTLPYAYVVMVSNDDMRMFHARWDNGRAEGFANITPRHPIAAACSGFAYLGFTADGKKIFFDTCLPEAMTHEELPEEFRPKPPEVTRGDQILYMDPEGQQVSTVSLGLPGFVCAWPLPSPTDNVIAVDCWRYPGGTEHNVYLSRLEDGMSSSVERLTDLEPGERMMPLLWSMDGHYLVGWDGRSCSTVIYLLDVDTRELKRVRPPEGWSFVGPSRWQWVSGPGYQLYALMVPECMDTALRPGRLIKIDLLTGKNQRVFSEEVEEVWVKTTSPNRRIR